MPDQRIPQAVPWLQEFSPEWKVILTGACLKPTHPVQRKEYPHSSCRIVPSHPDIKRGPAARVAAGPLQDGDYLLSHLRSTIGVTKLNFSVRNGKRWNLRAIVTWISFYVFMTHKQAIPARYLQAESIYHPSFLKESERAISNARLWCLHLYTCILSTSSSLTTLRNLILWPASYLDAFSTYPIPT